MNLSTPMISVIIPIYNANEYLEECLSSVQSQSYTNFEAILINDGSTDNSKEIAKKYCAIDSRFKLINQPNSGVAAARQVGLTHVKGEYVIHTDADDRMMTDSLSELYHCIVKNNSNIAIGAYIKEVPNTRELITCNHDEDISKKQFISNLLIGIYHSSLWNKLIKKELLEEVRFEENINYMEDKLFLLKVLKKDSVKIAVTNKIVYFYRAVDGSYTNKISQNSILSSIKVTKELTELYSDDYNEDFIDYMKNKVRIMVLLNSEISAKNVFPEANRSLLHDKRIPIKHKLIFLLDWLNIKGTRNIYLKLRRQCHPKK